jgi:transcriptional regulator with XRE-family HTH domain
MLNSRVKLLRKELHMSQETFGMRLGVTGAGISKIESGQRNLTEQMLILICREFDINEKWLRYGEGEIFRKKLSSGMEQLVDSYRLDELDKKIIYEYVTLDEKKRKVIKEYIMKIANESYASDLLSDGSQEKEVLRCAEEAGMEEAGAEEDKQQ